MQINTRLNATHHYSNDKRGGQSAFARLLNADIVILLLLAVEAAPLIIPEGLATISPLFYTAMHSLRYLSFLVIALHYILEYTRNRSIESPIYLAIIILIFISLRTAYYGNLSITSIMPYMMLLFSGLFICANKGRLDKVMLVVLPILEIWAYINLIAVITFPDGMYYSDNTGYTKNWIFGYKSSFQYYLLPAMIFALLNFSYRKQRIRTASLIVACLAQTILAGNMMLAVVAISIIAIFFSRIFKSTNIFNSITYITVIIIVNYIAIFGLSLFLNTELGNAFLSTLGKGADIGSRASVIWPLTLSYIPNNPIFGYGVVPSSIRVLQYSNVRGAIHSHNQTLELLYVGGIVLFILFAIFVAIIVIKLYRTKNLPTSQILALGMFGLFLCVVVEVFVREIAFPIWVMLFICYWSTDLHEQLSQRQEVQALVGKSFFRRGNEAWR